MTFEGNLSLDVTAEMSNRGVPQISRIHTLRQQCEGVEKIQILSVVVESEHRLYLAPANAKPWLKPVVGECPVERGMPLSQVPEVAIVNLRPNAQPIGDLRRDIHPEVRERPAAPAAMRCQPVVLIGIYESLRGKSVHLHRAIKEFELLCLQPDLACAEAHQRQFHDSSA